MKQRIEYIDALRGFAIILVVIGHLLEYNNYKTCTLFDLIYSFHMPLFFCISGFVTMYACRLNKDSEAKEYLNYIWKKFQTIMIPYLVWALIVNPFFFAGDFSIDSYKKTLDAALVQNMSYWFLPCLFILMVVFTFWKFVVDRCKKSSFITDTLLLISGGYY